MEKMFLAEPLQSHQARVIVLVSRLCESFSSSQSSLRSLMENGRDLFIPSLKMYSNLFLVSMVYRALDLSYSRAPQFGCFPAPQTMQLPVCNDTAEIG